MGLAGEFCPLVAFQNWDPIFAVLMMLLCFRCTLLIDTSVITDCLMIAEDYNFSVISKDINKIAKISSRLGQCPGSTPKAK